VEGDATTLEANTEMIKVVKLAHIGLNAHDLSHQAEFYNDRWGLERIEEHRGEMFFRAEGPSHHVLTLHESETLGGMHHVALEVATPAEVDQAHEELLAHGVEIVTPPMGGLEPGVAKALRFKDPDGFVVELVAGVDTVRDPIGNRDVKPHDVNHVVLGVTNMDTSETFYRDLLGFKMTDRFIGGLSFWYCNANHHSIALGEARDGKPTFNHVAFDLRDRDEWLKAVFYAGERGIPRAWGPGRHLFGNNLFSYYKDPEGNTVEYTAEVELLPPGGREPRIQEPLADVWQIAHRG
jgi:catechol-2,3-dioxygenase